MSLVQAKILEVETFIIPATDIFFNKATGRGVGGLEGLKF